MTATQRSRLHRDVRVEVGWSDHTPHGGPIGARLDHELRAALADPIGKLRAGAPLQGVHSALDEAIVAGAMDALIDRHRGVWSIRPDVLTPDPRLTTPTSIALTRNEQRLRVNLPASHWLGVHTLLASLQGHRFHDGDPTTSADMRALLAGLRDAGFVTDEPDVESLLSPLSTPGAAFVGHATVLVISKGARILVDPFVLPHEGRNPPSYQPLTISELGALDAVLITHTHPDHCDWATMLQLDARIPVIVPRVTEETALASDLRHRLAQIGMLDVRHMAPGGVERFGDTEVHALRFTGEQPSDSSRLHEAVRNEGNLYVVKTPDMSVVCVADGGRDSSGDVKDAATEWSRVHGPVDVVFSGYRGWITYPAQLLLSSVARFFLFLEPSAWSSRQRLMNDAADAIDTAERFGAHTLVPYADGGAPWFWLRGLGPDAEAGAERVGFDLLPERVADAASIRAVSVDGKDIASPVNVIVMRPGELLTPVGRIQRRPDHIWPYG